MSDTRKYGIGEVGFSKDGKHVPLVGDPRIALLCKAYKGEDLGEYELYATPGIGGWRTITRDDVEWGTSDIPELAGCKRLKVLVTAGNTSCPIDKVRKITNVFKGSTGAKIAEHFAREGCIVELLTSNKSLLWSLNPPPFHVLGYDTFDELRDTMRVLVETEGYDIIIHSAAVSDYKVEGAYVDRYKGAYRRPELDKLDSSGKISSDIEEMFLKLVKTPKIVDEVRGWGFTGILVKFKLQVDMPDDELIDIAAHSMAVSKADVIVANTLEHMHEYAYIIDAPTNVAQKCSRGDLPKRLFDVLQTRNFSREEIQ